MDETPQEQPQGPKLTMYIAVGVVVLLLIGGVFYLNANRSQSAKSTVVPTTATAIPTNPVPAVSEAMKIEGTDAAAMQQGSTKTFTVTGKSFSFAPAEIRVKKGDNVKIIFTNVGGMHNFVISELGVKTPVIASGKTAEVSFVAGKAGTYEYYCSVGNHRQMGMVGTLIVQ